MNGSMANRTERHQITQLPIIAQTQITVRPVMCLETDFRVVGNLFFGTSATTASVTVPLQHPIPQTLEIL